MSDAEALTFWENVETQAIWQAWRELPAGTGDRQARVLAVAGRLDLPPTLVERVIYWPRDVHAEVITDELR